MKITIKNYGVQLWLEAFFLISFFINFFKDTHCKTVNKNDLVLLILSLFQ